MSKRPITYDVLIIGGGASGLCAGLAAASRGAKTLVLESQTAIGKKILATGNGRCNLSNLNLSPTFFGGEDKRFTEPIIRLWTPGQMLNFWHDMGLATRTEEERVYPYSLQAKSLLNILSATLAQSGCSVKTEQKVVDIEYRPPLKLQDYEDTRSSNFLVRCDTEEIFLARKIILCSGGMAAPALGTNGEAYALYTKFGHRIIKPKPALVQLLCPRLPKRLSGIRSRVELKLKLASGAMRREAGELLFTDYGLSGICVLNLSEFVERELESSSKLHLSIDFLPDMTAEQACQFVRTLCKTEAQTPALFWGVGLLPEKLSVVIYEQVFLALNIARGYKTRKVGAAADELRLADLSDEQIRRLVETAKAWLVEVNGTKGFGFAQVTAGGLASKDFNPYTLESLIVPGLFACGEVLDVHGPCGGYNLHWAFASGSTAGTQAALALV